MSASVRCGACCHSCSVEFSVYALDSMGGTLPEALTEEVNGGTCRIYEQRPRLAFEFSRRPVRAGRLRRRVRQF